MEREWRHPDKGGVILFFLYSISGNSLKRLLLNMIKEFNKA
jgi:hypothetical protein